MPTAMKFFYHWSEVLLKNSLIYSEELCVSMTSTCSADRLHTLTSLATVVPVSTAPGLGAATAASWGFACAACAG